MLYRAIVEGRVSTDDALWWAATLRDMQKHASEQESRHLAPLRAEVARAILRVDDRAHAQADTPATSALLRPQAD